MDDEDEDAERDGAAAATADMEAYKALQMKMLDKRQ